MSNPIVTITAIVVGAVLLNAFLEQHENATERYWLLSVEEALYDETDFPEAFWAEYGDWIGGKCFNTGYYSALELILPRYLPKAIFKATDDTEAIVSVEQMTYRLDNRLRPHAKREWSKHHQEPQAECLSE